MNRVRGIAIGLLALVSVSLLSPPAASADDFGYLDGLADIGINITDASQALGYGYKICAAVDNAPMSEVFRAVQVDHPWMTPYRSGQLVGLALRELCIGEDL